MFFVSKVTWVGIVRPSAHVIIPNVFIILLYVELQKLEDSQETPNQQI